METDKENEKNKDMIFFTPEGPGLTSTSANHIANLAKEMVRGLEATLAALTLYSTSVSLIGSPTADLLSQGASAEELNDVKPRLHAIAKAKSLIAWLREAIKAKERLIKKVESITDDEYVKLMGLDPIIYPKRGEFLTEDEYYASLSLDERNRYYELETLAAVLGKAIHPEGSFAEAREEFNRRLYQPRDVKRDGRDTLIYTYTPTVDSAEVENLYFRLQKQYREVQANLNAMKFECQKAVKASEIAVSTAYADELKKANDYAEGIRAEMSVYIKMRTREIGNYRIVIPESLKAIFEEVSSLGKK